MSAIIVLVVLVLVALSNSLFKFADAPTTAPQDTAGASALAWLLWVAAMALFIYSVFGGTTS